jgi:uncharacterized protein (DUF58 family)
VQYLDPVVLSSIGSLDLLARMVVDGFISGMHQSPYRGFNVEFTEHRPYAPGDEIRHIDWRAYAKVDRFLVKQFEEETNLRAYLLLDVSRSMDYGGEGRISKLDYARIAASCLAYLMLKQRDSVGLLTFSSEIHQYVPPRGRASHLEAITEQLKETELGQDTSLETVLGLVAERVRRRGLVIIVSDFIDHPESVLRGLRHLKHFRHDIILLHVMDPDELDLPHRGLARFEDPETKQQILTDPGRLQEDYKRRIEAMIQEYRDGSTEAGMDYLLLKTTDPLDRALAHYLALRKKTQAGSRTNLPASTS